MQRFILKVTLFLSIQAAIGAALWSRASKEPDGYCASTLDKHRRADAIPSPRLLLIGGSNLAFGVDSTALEQRMGLPVVNMAISAGGGLDFILNEADSVARRGDVLLVSLEYEHFVSDMTLTEHVQQLVSARPGNAAYLSFGQVKRLLDRGLVTLHSVAREGLRRKRPSANAFTVYAREAFDEHGDVTAHHDQPASYDLKKLYGELPQAPVDREAIRQAVWRLNDFVIRCEQDGIRVLFAFPPVAEDYYASQRGLIDAVAEIAAAELAAPIINDLSQVVLPPGMFFDTAYHLSLAGKRVHTAALAEGAAAVINSSRRR